jgi:predicted 2-oxoglutarate/Fe(II)-dependent dioxygenase YbiX/peroxiredoxin
MNAIDPTQSKTTVEPRPVPALNFADLQPGDPFPWVRQRTESRPSFAIDSVGGRYLVFCFYGTTAVPPGRAAIEAAVRNRALFNDERMMFFGVCVDPEDEMKSRVPVNLPGMRFLWDFDRSVCRACGAIPTEVPPNGGPMPFRQFWLIVDPSLHVLAKIPFENEPVDHAGMFAILRGLPPPASFAGFEIPAPVLVLPNVFEPDLCQRLIALYDADGGTESGVHRDGRGVQDHSFKRRRDYAVEDHMLKTEIQQKIVRRVIPEITKLFFMNITRMERYIVGCYAAEDQAHFRPHRDNSQALTAHRRFAVSINLNADFEGGEVSFPEYNPRGIKAPPGWAVVFPAAILHMVSMVTKGRRYAFLPFVYDDAGAAIRQRNFAQHASQNSTEI